MRSDGKCTDKDVIEDEIKKFAIIIPILVIAVLAAFVVLILVCCCFCCNKKQKGYIRSRPQNNSPFIQPTIKSSHSLHNQPTSLPVKTVLSTNYAGQQPPPPAVYFPPSAQENSFL